MPERMRNRIARLRTAAGRRMCTGLLAAGSCIAFSSFAQDLGQPIAPDRLVAGQSYVLRVVLQDDSGPGAASVIFRIPDGNQTFRTYKTPIDARRGAVTELSFVAPAFTRMASIRLEGTGVPDLRVKTMTLEERAPIAHTAPVADARDSFVPRGYRMVFNDEFDGASLDRSKWFTRYLQANETLDHLADEKQRYRDNDNHGVGWGLLRLTARRNDAGGYDSGMIRSDWTARYGYFEARVKMPAARGVFPAFWLNSDVGADGTQQWPPEIDIFEFVNNGIEDLPDMLHTGVIPSSQREPAEFLFADPAFNHRWTYWKAPFDFDKGWHTVGAEWTENGVSTFVDGRKIVERAYPWRHPDGRLAPKAYILLNLAIGGNWAGRHGIDDASLPASLEIDWVRAYERAPDFARRPQPASTSTLTPTAAVPGRN